MITLDNFTKLIDKKTLEKGMSYFLNEAVSFLEEVEDGKWEAEVIGTETYAVEVEINEKREITESLCDCPVEDTCKHEIAVYYAIIEILKNPSSKKNSKTKKKSLEVLLNEADKNSLKELISKYAQRDKGFRAWITAMLDVPTDRTQYFIQKFKTIRRQSSEDGYIHYGASRGFEEDVNELVAELEDEIERNNDKMVFKTTKALIELMPEVAQSIDDSNGTTGGIMYSYIELIRKIYDRSKSLEFKKEILEFSKDCAKNPELGNYGLNDEIEDFFEEKSQDIYSNEDMIEFYKSKMTNDTLHSNKTNIFKIRDILAKDSPEKAWIFLVEQLKKYPKDYFLRIKIIGEKIEEKDYILAKNLGLEGIKIFQNEKYIINRFKELLLDIALLENNISGWVQLKEQMFWEEMNIINFKELKEHYPKEKWNDFVQKVIKVVNAKEHKDKYSVLNVSGFLCNLYFEENKAKELLEEVSKIVSIDLLERFKPLLSKTYPKELGQLYLKEITNMMNHASDRDRYKFLAQLLKEVSKLGFKTEVLALVQEFMNKYSNRRAMKEELNLVLKDILK
jgi:hypothetical protein